MHVRSFAEVALRGTVVAAATAIGYTPPAVSQHVAKLEAAMGADLFHRRDGRLRMTDAGTALLPIALDLLDLERRATGAAVPASGRAHLVVAGFASAIATLVLPRLATLDRRFELDIIEAEDDHALRELSLGHVDVVLVQEYDGFAIDRDARFVHTPLTRDALRLVIPPDRPTSTRLEDLGDVRWIFNGTGTRCTQAATRLLTAAGLRPPTGGTVTDNSTLLALVAAGQGVAIVPELVIAEHHRTVRVADQDLRSSRTILAVTRSSPGPTTTQLVDALRI